jgi:hypothetical protein
LERVLAQTEKLLHLVTPPAVHEVVASAETKMRLVSSLAARIQAFTSVLESAGENTEKVRARIAELHTQMLDVDSTE